MGCKKNGGNRLATAGTDWNLAVLTGAGKSIDEAVTKLYENVDGFSLLALIIDRRMILFPKIIIILL